MGQIPVVCPDLLRDVLVAAVAAPGNRLRFLAAGLIDPAGALVTDWQTAFTRLKPLSKAELRSHPGQFLAWATDIVFRGKTSGTGGEAFTYFAGDRWNQKRIEARQRSLSEWGIEATTPIVNLASRLFPVRAQDSSLVGTVDSTFLKILLAVVGTEPVILRGYPSRLCEVAVALHHTQTHLQLSSVVAVIATGECLFEGQRSLLTQTFRAPVINEYGCQESGISGLSCPEEGRLHLDSDRCLYEVLDGKLLTTDLYNHAMPLVRYSSQDVLKLFSSPCPCGRPGLTAQILGRQEEVMVVEGKQRWPAEFELPPFPNILDYQIQLSPERRRLWVQPNWSDNQPDLTPLKAWIDATWGEKATEVIVESPLNSQALRSAEVSLNAAVDSATWLNQVIQQPWSSWLNSPLPLGEVQETADLLRQLVAPRHIVLQGLPPRALQLFQRLRQSKVEGNSIEGMKIRTLLWAVGLMAGEAELESVEAKTLYLELLERFQHWVNGKDKVQENFSSLGFDLLAPLHTLNIQTSQTLWPSVQALIQTVWPNGIKADRFTIHHYLAVLDQAGKKAQRQPHVWIPALRPLSAVLQGDMTYFVRDLDLEMVAVWAETIHSCPGAFTQEQHKADFRHIWQAERRALLQQDRAAVSSLLSRLFSVAQSPEQVARCWLEKGYAQLTFGEYLNPTEWMEVLQQHVGLLESPKNGAHRPVSNPLPWLPILNALAPKLAEIGKPDLAYACLFAAAPPNRHLSNFDCQTHRVNGKQTVIGWCADS